MENEEGYTIRKVQRKDVDQLKDFFIKAYGEDTVFQSESFLEWYFNSESAHSDFMKECIVGIDKDQQIISHYGGLKYSLKIGDKITPLIWGVNAFTLQQHRGKGVNSKILDFINENNEINGVIGFTKKTALFYKDIGYNIFDFEKFSRYIYIIDRDKTLKAMEYIGQSSENLIYEKSIFTEDDLIADHPNIIRLDKNNIDDFTIGFDVEIYATTNRDKKFIKWRLLDNPFIDYCVYGFVENKVIIGYIACREEVLFPLEHKANRIIDIFGNSGVIPYLLKYSIHKSILKGSAYIDFSKFGDLYEEALLSQNFGKLEGENVAILPQVTCPMSYRVNDEYIGFSGKKHKADLDLMEKNNVYFTRIDSDRDRLAKYSQIKSSLV
ncbi:MAG: GNAT family N-acetyltransferase [Negativicutes bacterium]